MSTTVLAPATSAPSNGRWPWTSPRDTCARYYIRGCPPADTVRAYGLATSSAATWAHAVNLIAELHCTAAARKQMA